jgi:hypothetical protein
LDPFECGLEHTLPTRGDTRMCIGKVTLMSLDTSFHASESATRPAVESCQWCDERACTVGAWCTTVVNLRVCACNKVAVPHFNIILSSTVLGLVTRPRPRRTISVSGIRLERFVAPRRLSSTHGEHSLRGHIGASGRVCAVVGREIEHPRACTVSCGGGTVARSMRRPPQPTPR